MRQVDAGGHERCTHSHVGLTFRRTTTARSRRRQRAALGDRLHVLQRARERRRPRQPIFFLGGIVAHRRVVVDQRVDQLRRGGGHRPRFERAVIEDVRTARAHRLRVGIRELGLADQDLVRDRPHGAELTILALGDRAGNLEPLADVAVLADALPDFGSRLVDCDLERNRDVGRIGDDGGIRRGCGLRRRGRCLCRDRCRDACDDEQRAENSSHLPPDNRSTGRGRPR